MKKLVLAVVVAVILGGSNAWALITPSDTSPAVPQVYQAINTVMSGVLGYVPLTSNADANTYQVAGPNSFWTHLGGGIASNFAAIGLTANNTNTLGTYDNADPNVLIPSIVLPSPHFGYLGSGTALDPYLGGINPFISGETFGFYLNSVNGTDETWFSDPGRNDDDLDHMLAYYLPGLDGHSVYIQTVNGLELLTFTEDTYFLAWEDLRAGHPSSDLDYNDALFLVTRVTPVPEPMSMALLGTGLAGLVTLKRRKS